MASSQLLAERATVPYDVPTTLPAGRGIDIRRTAIVMPFISFIFICMRFYSKLVMKKVKLRLDDYIVGATFLLSIAHSVLMANATYNGMGLHIWQYTPDLNSRYYLWIGISSEFYAICLMGFKSSLILLYLQLFGNTNRKFRWCCYALLVYTCGYISANMFTEFLGCTPISKKWIQSEPGHCINSVVANIIYGFGHMSSDLMIGILPLPMIWRMRFKTTKEKLGLSLVLTSGFIAWAIACVRWAIATYNMLSYDRPWWAGLSFLFSILEVHTGIICCCVATSGPLMKLFFKNIKNATQRTAARYGSHSHTDGSGSSGSRTRQSISVAKHGARKLSHAALHPVSLIRGGGGGDRKKSASAKGGDGARPGISSPIVDYYPASATTGTPPMADVSQMGMPGHRMAPPAPSRTRPQFFMPSYGTDTQNSNDSRSDFIVDGGAFLASGERMDLGPRDVFGGPEQHIHWYGSGGAGGVGSSQSSSGGGVSDGEGRRDADRDRKRMSDEENLLRIA